MRVSAFAAGDQQPDLAFFKRNMLGHAEEQQGVGSFTCTFLGHFRLQLMAEGVGGGDRTMLLDRAVCFHLRCVPQLEGGCYTTTSSVCDNQGQELLLSVQPVTGIRQLGCRKGRNCLISQGGGGQ